MSALLAPLPEEQKRAIKYWTYDDYLALPEDGKRYEIIEGGLYVNNAPSFQHQYVVSRLDRTLGGYIEEQQLGFVVVAPFEVQLPRGIGHPVQPDVLFISKAQAPQLGKQFFTGAPELVIEVISPSSIRTDRMIKFSAYERAGVKEYWLVEPRLRSIEVFVLTILEIEDEENPGTMKTEQQYVLHGQFCGDEKLSSALLEGFSVVVGSLFAAE